MPYIYVDEAFVAKTKEAIMGGTPSYDAVREHLVAQASEWSGDPPLGAQLFLHWAALRLDEPVFAAINEAKGGTSILGPLALLPGGSV